MTREILRMVRKKRRFWRIYKSSSSLQDKEAYMKVEKERTKKIRNAKRKLERERWGQQTRITESSPNT
jgi:hypothetical protein